MVTRNLRYALGYLNQEPGCCNVSTCRSKRKWFEPMSVIAIYLCRGVSYVPSAVYLGITAELLKQIPAK